MNFPHGVMVTLVSVTTTDDGLGNTTEETVTYEWGPCGIAPRYANESTDPRAPQVIVGKTVYGPPIDVDPADLSIDSDDLLILPDGPYQVVGHEGAWVSPFSGWAPGLEVPVKRASAV